MTESARDAFAEMFGASPEPAAIEPEPDPGPRPPKPDLSQGSGSNGSAPMTPGDEFAAFMQSTRFQTFD